jgi:hypothetical protein
MLRVNLFVVLVSVFFVIPGMSIMASGMTYEVASVVLEGMDIKISKNWSGGLVSAQKVWSRTKLSISITAQPGYLVLSNSIVDLGQLQQSFIEEDPDSPSRWLSSAFIYIEYDQDQARTVDLSMIKILYALRSTREEGSAMQVFETIVRPEFKPAEYPVLKIN